jgi:RHS repeat-associated protein
VTEGGSSLLDHFGYDADGLLVSAGDLALTRDAQNGRLTGSTLNTVNDSWNYTGFGEAQSYVAAAASTALYAMSFTRDHAGRISTKTETLGGVTSVYTYTYDAARGWLTDVSSNGLHTAHYDYDDNGNRTGALTLDREVSYAAADGQDRITGGTLTQPLQAAQNVSWSYTANGEVSGRTVGTATTLYSYDVRGNLRDVTLTNGVRIEYLVDATGRRLGRKVGGTLTRGWLYQDGLKPVAELDGAGNVVSRFVYGGKANVPEYVVKNGTEYRLITDQLGSVRLVVNAADGSLAQRLDYDEFGRVLNDSNPGFQPFGYAGGLYDPDTGLVRFGARDYDADAGRWMSMDPIGFGGGDNWYAYCGNEPVNFIDSLGLKLGNIPSKLGFSYIDISNTFVKAQKLGIQYSDVNGNSISMMTILNNILASDETLSFELDNESKTPKTGPDNKVGCFFKQSPTIYFPKTDPNSTTADFQAADNGAMYHFDAALLHEMIHAYERMNGIVSFTHPESNAIRIGNALENGGH